MKIFLTGNQHIRIIILIVSVMMVSLIPYETLFDETYTICIHRYLFGFECPFCGMTRAVYQILHLQFSSAVSYNAVVTLLPLYFVVDITTIFFRQNWLVLVRKIIVALIIAGFLLLYAFRFSNHFNWI